MGSFFQKFVTFITQSGPWDLFSQIKIIDLIDILVVTVIIYQMLKLTQRTRAYQVLKGIALLFIFAQLSTLLRMSALSWLLNYTLQLGAVALVVLFQPELRQALERLGRSKFIDRTSFTASPDNTWVADEIVKCAISLSRQCVGALIVLQRGSMLGEIIESGTFMGAKVSSELLENLFVPNTPLHDGAVVISEQTIMAAGCFLPSSTNPNLSQTLGTRHRAALGISEVSDAMAVVVSEETGIISVSVGGQLIRYLDEKSLRQLLMEVYDPTPNNKAFDSLLRWRHRNEKNK